MFYLPVYQFAAAIYIGCPISLGWLGGIGIVSVNIIPSLHQN